MNEFEIEFKGDSVTGKSYCMRKIIPLLQKEGYEVKAFGEHEIEVERGKI